jgi:glyoxylase-like metal-dependent hydrolase (beta-lactamase superfamily II)
VRASEVTPGVRRMWFPAIDNNSYLIMGSDPTLIDCGPPGNAPALLGHLRSLGMVPGDVRHIAVTHCHTDHTGQLAEVARATGATVYAHPIDALIIRAGAERPRGKPHGLVGKVMLAMARRSSRADPAVVDVEIGDGQELPAAGGLRCLHTPGHTAGHVSFLWPGAGGVLFVGDAAANMLRLLDIAPLNEDDVAARASFRKLAELEFSYACFGHGSPIRGRAVSAFRRKVERAAS